MQVYSTIREAAIDGTREAIRLTRRDGWEYGGVVIAENGAYKVSEIVTSRERDGVNLSQAYPKKWLTLTKFNAELFRQFSNEVVAHFHVHAPGEYGNYKGVTDTFSGQDVNIAINLRTLAYLGASDTGKVYELDARSEEAFFATQTKMELDRVGLVSSGDIGNAVAVKGTEVYGGDNDSQT